MEKKLLKTVKNGQKDKQRSKTFNNGKISFFKCQKRSPTVKKTRSNTVKNGQKWSKISKNGQKRSRL